ncbi:hypothetical protein ACE2AJ_14865 [Aquihabitans daechungensis]|uniref:hypothetical protein n=1 Tax=Aquihabitans daechungensis TaxID=1052257 RepID=UPI003BA08D88
MSSPAERVRSALADGRLELPPVGEGRTADRWRALVELAVLDVDLARLAEAHVDAVQILHEADRGPEPGQVLGVWASEHPAAPVRLSAPNAAQDRTLSGSKAFCSGAGIVDAALVTVMAPEGPLLVQVPGALLGPVRIDDTAWKVAALRGVRTATVDLDGVVVPADAVVGPPGWYLGRPGFWAGAVGAAACWAGAAIGLVHLAARRSSDDPHALAHLGAMTADERALRSVLHVAGLEQDAGDGGAGAVQRRALEVRHLVDVLCADIEDRFARCLGPRGLVFDAAAAERRQAVSIYRRQCHGERDLAVLGAEVRLADPPART